jgi:hypothetical protein
MQEGFLLEHRVALRWIGGKPDASWLGDINAHGRKQRQVGSYRCVGCGYLELYAEAEISFEATLTGAAATSSAVVEPYSPSALGSSNAGESLANVFTWLENPLMYGNQPTAMRRYEKTD